MSDDVSSGIRTWLTTNTTEASGEFSVATMTDAIEKLMKEPSKRRPAVLPPSVPLWTPATQPLFAVKIGEDLACASCAIPHGFLTKKCKICAFTAGQIEAFGSNHVLETPLIDTLPSCQMMRWQDNEWHEFEHILPEPVVTDFTQKPVSFGDAYVVSSSPDSVYKQAYEAFGGAPLAWEVWNEPDGQD